MVPHRYALAQLAEAMIVQAIPQLWLAHQKNLQKLPTVSFQIGKQPHLFEQLVERESPSFLETSYLLIYGHLPSNAELDDWRFGIRRHAPRLRS